MNQHCNKWNLKRNFDKTKAMVFPNERKLKNKGFLYFNGPKLETVKKNNVSGGKVRNNREMEES
jgi:hypothetical protein